VGFASSDVGADKYREQVVRDLREFATEAGLSSVRPFS
jgi:hypothetical protein